MSVHSLPSLMKRDLDTGSAGRPRQPRWRTLLQQERKDLLSVSLWRGAFAEFVGTGLLCTFTIGFGMAPEGKDPPPVFQIAIAVGFFIGCVITAFANVSGGHVNPAISVAFCVTGHCTIVRFLLYSVFQIMGAVTGTGLLKYMSPSGHVGGLGLILPGEGVTDEQAVVAEIAISFFLIFVTVSQIDPGRTDVGGSVPFMVGLSVAVNIFFANTTSGACMNPARALGPAIITGNWDRQWIYCLGPMSGALIGSVLYDVCFSVRRITNKRWCNPLEYDTFGDPDDDNNDDGDDTFAREKYNNDEASETLPLHNGNKGFTIRDKDFESDL